MQKVLALLIGLVILSGNVWADSISKYYVSSYRVLGSHALLLFDSSGNAKYFVKVPYCYLNSSSKVMIIKDYTSNYDKIIVDQETCDVNNIESF